MLLTVVCVAQGGVPLSATRAEYRALDALGLGDA